MVNTRVGDGTGLQGEQALNQQQKAERFQALHQGPLFVIPNPWDAGSARLLAGFGFQALAATDLPVSADLENGYGDTPEAAAETTRLAAAVGLVGSSIEDATGNAADPIYDFDLSVERVAAAAEAAHALSFPYTFVARAENFLHGRNDLDDTIRRLQAYEKAGADVLFAPGLPNLDAIRTVCASVTKPVNIVLGAKHTPYSLADLAAAGVRRVSTGSSFARAALTGLRDASLELLGPGTATYLDDAISFAEVTALMAAKR